MVNQNLIADVEEAEKAAGFVKDVNYFKEMQVTIHG